MAEQRMVKCVKLGRELPGLPVTIFIDRHGRIAYKQIGITDIDILRDQIEALL